MVNQKEVKDGKVKAGTKELLSLEVHKSMRPKDEKRKRTPITRLSTSPNKVVHREVVIKKGKGKKLSDLPNVEHQIDKHKHSDEVITNAHRLLYGTAGKTHSAKKEIREFSGCIFDATFTKDALKKKLEGKQVNPLRDLCDLFCLERSGTKEEVVERLFAFLEKPHATDIVPKSASRKRSRSPSPTRSRSRSRSSSPVKKSKKEDESDKEASGDEKKKKRSKKTKSSKKDKKSKKSKDEKKEKRPLTSFMKFSQEVRPQTKKDHPSLGVTDIAKEIGKQWRELSQKEKDKYK